MFGRVFALLIFSSVTVVASSPKTPPSSIVLPRPSSATLRIGSLTLHRCKSVPAYCGSIDRPLDPSGRVPGTIAIGFELYPHTDRSQPPLETVVATEGGPGYATTGSGPGYLQLFAPLHDRRDILLVDSRGTGKSQPLNCPELQKESNPKFPGVRTCGTQLGNAAYLYGSGLVADDLAAVLNTLNIPTIDLYGDSYGTWFSQTFAGLHPDRLRVVVLDSAYPVIGQSPWYPEIASTAHFAFNAACARSPACSYLPGTSMERIGKLVDALRQHPISGYAHDGNGVLRATRADATSLAYLMVSNSTQSVVYRELDPAARAYLENNDPAPLLRLLAENNVAGESGGANPGEYSQAIFVAVSCADYPQVYDMTLPPDSRKIDRDQSISREEQDRPQVYAPFTIDEFDKIPLDTSVVDLCLLWPPPSVDAYPPGHPVAKDTQFTKAPVLVLSGDLDSLTPALQGKHADALFENGRQVIVENSFHVTAVGDQDNCASGIAQRFIRDLDPGDTSCTDHIAEVHLVPKFANTAAELESATPGAENKGTDADLRVAAAAAYTAGDAVSLWWVNLSGKGVGFRGGHFRYKSTNHLTYFKLDKMKWVDDVEVSGKMTWDYNYPGTVKAHVKLAGSGTQAGELEIGWDSHVPLSQATITGQISGRHIAATIYAP